MTQNNFSVPYTSSSNKKKREKKSSKISVNHIKRRKSGDNGKKKQNKKIICILYRFSDSAPVFYVSYNGRYIETTFELMTLI